ncbi:MAG: ROK family protein, partial [Bacteroidales bacterium]|nr:ROK family protein [Bacteroidales bacterium]
MAKEVKPYVVGMDIGGTNTVFGIVDQAGNVVCQDSIKTKAYPVIDDYVNAIGDKLDVLIESVGGKDKIQGMGVGAPNGNYYTGNIEFAPNLAWKGIVPLAKLFSERIGVPCKLTNDANAAAIGEMTYGAAKGMKHFIMITLGTGVGSGIVIDGKMVYGHDGFAGELGHIIAVPDGRECGCGRKGCLEAYCSATGIVRTAKEVLKNSYEPSTLRNVPEDELTSKDIFDCAMAGDAIAKDIFQKTGELLGKALANFTVFSSPEAFIIFGGLAKAGDLIFKPVKEAMEENMLAVFKNKVKVLPSQLKDA